VRIKHLKTNLTTVKNELLAARSDKLWDDFMYLWVLWVGYIKSIAFWVGYMKSIAFWVLQ
jgi:hypothetical protein